MTGKKKFLVQNNDTKQRITEELDVNTDAVDKDSVPVKPRPIIFKGPQESYVGDNLAVSYGFAGDDIEFHFYEHRPDTNPFPEDTGKVLTQIIEEIGGEGLKAKAEKIDDPAIGGASWYVLVKDIRLRPVLVPKVLEGLIKGLDKHWSKVSPA